MEAALPAGKRRKTSRWLQIKSRAENKLDGAADQEAGLKREIADMGGQDSNLACVERLSLYRE